MRFKSLFFNASAAGLVAGGLLINNVADARFEKPKIPEATSILTPISFDGVYKAAFNMPAMELGVNSFRTVSYAPAHNLYVNTSGKNFLQFKSYARNFAQLEDYCDRIPERCMATYPGQPVQMTEELFKTVSFYNRQVNNAIEYKDDKSAHGVEDHWGEGEWGENDKGEDSLVGDCDDYALEKRRLLAEVIGIPYSALSLAYVEAPSLYNRKGEVTEYTGHAVLVLRTTEGDYVLDNRNNDVLLPSQTDLVFHSATNFERFKEWRSVESMNVRAPTAAPK